MENSFESQYQHALDKFMAMPMDELSYALGDQNDDEAVLCAVYDAWKERLFDLSTERVINVCSSKEELAQELAAFKNALQKCPFMLRMLATTYMEDARKYKMKFKEME